MTIPASAWTITLDSRPTVAAMQIVSVLASPTPKGSQRYADILLAWHHAEARADGIAALHDGMSPARIEDRLSAIAKNISRRFEAVDWAIMLATRDASIRVRIEGAPYPTVRALAGWLDRGEVPNIIRDVWSASKPVLAMAAAIRGQFDHSPTLDELCFAPGWVEPAVASAEAISAVFAACPALSYDQKRRIKFAVPNLISV